MTTAKEYHILRTLTTNQAYQMLEALWMHQVADIEKKRDKAAHTGGESAWRYWAGQEKGFKLAMTALARALMEMEATETNLQAQEEIERTLEELRSKKEPT